MRNFLADVPALEPLRLVVGLELRGRGDVQLYRVELPGPVVSKDIASDAKVRLQVTRSHFNELAADGFLRDEADFYTEMISRLDDAKVRDADLIARLTTVFTSMLCGIIVMLCGLASTALVG